MLGSPMSPETAPDPIDPDLDSDDDEAAPQAAAVDRRRVTATDADAGARLDKFLADAFPALSRARVRRLIESGHVTRDGARETAGAAKVRAGAAYDLLIPLPGAGEGDGAPGPEDIPLTILFEDAHLLVVDKPAGLSVHPAPGNWTGTLVNAVLHHAGESLLDVGAAGRPGIVHRLDKDTSGVMVVAKSEFAMASLGRQFQARTIDRLYRAFGVGTPRPPWGLSGRIETRLARDPRDRKKMSVVAAHAEAGKQAATNYAIDARFGRLEAAPFGPRACAMTCKLETGRTHQIRVHMAHVGCPLIGDPVYGDTRPARALTEALPDEARIARQALHAQSLAFTHPATGARLTFETPPPADMARLERALRGL
jgi:23S rRNA pseudouridine1911/1915/1917 synthase